MADIQPEAIVRVIEGLLKFPYAQICRHAIACDLLDILEKAGNPVSNELAEAVVKAEDGIALALLAGDYRRFRGVL